MNNATPRRTTSRLPTREFRDQGEQLRVLVLVYASDGATTTHDHDHDLREPTQ